MVQPPTVHVDAANVTVLTSGDTYRVICEATGNPQPAIMWTKDGVDVNDLSSKRASNRAGKLKIRDVTPSDSGEYVCVADNGQGGRDERMLILLVQEGMFIILTDYGTVLYFLFLQSAKNERSYLDKWYKAIHQKTAILQ